MTPENRRAKEYHSLTHYQRSAYDELEQWGWTHAHIYATIRTLGEWKI